MQLRWQLRRDTKERWETINPVLAAGEMGLETDTNRLKIGDGLRSWTSLNYFESSVALNKAAMLTLTQDVPIDSYVDASDVISEFPVALVYEGDADDYTFNFDGTNGALTSITINKPGIYLFSLNGIIDGTSLNKTTVYLHTHIDGITYYYSTVNEPDPVASIVPFGTQIMTVVNEDLVGNNITFDLFAVLTGNSTATLKAGSQLSIIKF